MENSKDFIHKNAGTNNRHLSKGAEYRVSIQNQLHILYTNYPKRKQSKKEIEKTIPLIIASKKKKKPKNELNHGGG